MDHSNSDQEASDLRAAADRASLKTLQRLLTEAEKKVVESERKLGLAKTRIQALESQGNQSGMSLDATDLRADGCVSIKDVCRKVFPSQFSIDNHTMVLAGGHIVKPADPFAQHRFTNTDELHVVQRIVKVEVFVSIESLSSDQPYFTVYWENTKTVENLREEISTTMAKPLEELVIFDSCGKVLQDSDPISCTITKSGEEQDSGWVLCQVKMKTGAGAPAGGELDACVLHAAELMVHCSADEDDDEIDDDDCDDDHDEAEDDHHEDDGNGDTGSANGAVQHSAKELQRLYASADENHQGAVTLEEAGNYLDGPADAQIPNFRRFHKSLPTETECEVPDSVSPVHALHALRDGFEQMGLSHESEWRTLPKEFHAELAGLVNMNPLDASLPTKLECCFSAMKIGVDTLTSMTPFEPAECKEELQALEEKLHLHRDGILEDGEREDEESEDEEGGDCYTAAIATEICRELEGFDRLYGELQDKYNLALGRTRALEIVKEEGRHFDESKEQLAGLIASARAQLDHERLKHEQTQQTLAEAEALKSKIEQQMTWSLELNLLAKQAARCERDRLDEEIARLRRRRRAVAGLLSRHCLRREEILEAARENRMSYWNFRLKQERVAAQVKTRIDRAENEFRVVSLASSKLEKLQDKYEACLESARVDSEEWRLDTGIDAFKAYSGSRRFHFISLHRSVSDEEELKQQLVECEKAKRKLATKRKAQPNDSATKEQLDGKKLELNRAKDEHAQVSARTTSLKERRERDFKCIEPILDSIKRNLAAGAASSKLLFLRETALALEHPDEWEESYKEDVRTYDARMEEEVQLLYQPTQQERIGYL